MSKLSLVLNLELYFVYEQDCILGSACHCANYSFSTAFDICEIDKKCKFLIDRALFELMELRLAKLVSFTRNRVI